LLHAVDPELKVEWYAILALLWLAQNHTVTSFQRNTIPACHNANTCHNACKCSDVVSNQGAY